MVALVRPAESATRQTGGHGLSFLPATMNSNTPQNRLLAGTAAILRGHFTPRGLACYFLAGYTLIAGLCLTAYGFYQAHYHAGHHPDAAPYSVFTSTFSFLGSFDARKNPEGWLFFSLALWTVALFLVPLTRYIGRRMAVIHPAGARAGMGLLLLGAAAIALVGVFPDSGQDFVADLHYGKIHNLVALLAFAGLSFGPLWFGLMLARFNPFRPGHRPPDRNDARAAFHRPALHLPFFLLAGVLTTAMCFLIRWECIYRRLGQPHWPGVGVYAFPLWEWLYILTLFLALAWFSLALPNQIPAPTPPSRAP
jgi:hypothetical protein